MGKSSRMKLLTALLVFLISSLTLASDDSDGRRERGHTKDRQLRRKRGRDQFYAYRHGFTYGEESTGSHVGKRESKSSERGKGKGGSKSKKSSKSKSGSSKSSKSGKRNDTFSPTWTPTKFPEIPSMELGNGPTESLTLYPTISPTTVPTKTPTMPPTRVATETPTAAPTKAPVGTLASAPTNSPVGSPSRMPTVSPSLTPTLAGSILPSMQPSVRLQRIRVTDYYIAYAIPGLMEEPSQDDVDLLLEYTRQFFVTVFEDYYADSDVQFLDLKYELEEWRYNASIPEERFNLYMNYDTVVLYELDSPQPASPLESFTIMVNTDFAPYLTDYVRTIPAFVTVNEIDFRAIRTFEPASREDRAKPIIGSDQLFTTNVFCRSKKRVLPFCK